tara:strand:- start:59 stop:313 length:255 start_codon:yes stop_codon:yes gene_type:complete
MSKEEKLNVGDKVSFVSKNKRSGFPYRDKSIVYIVEEIEKCGTLTLRQDYSDKRKKGFNTTEPGVIIPSKFLDKFEIIKPKEDE